MEIDVSIFCRECVQLCIASLFGSFLWLSFFVFGKMNELKFACENV